MSSIITRTGNFLINLIDGIYYMEDGTESIIEIYNHITLSRCFPDDLLPPLEWKHKYSHVIWIYLVMCYGNYGTSPFSGWLPDNIKDDLHSLLFDWIDAMLDEEERSKML